MCEDSNSMASSLEESSTCSPDSTVSSLLSSIDSNNPCSNSLIQYKDKLYSSASEALEAYIEDFDLSLTSSEISTGKICIYQSTPKKVKISKHHAKDSQALDGFNQHIGLGSLASPSQRQSDCDLDSISLATDDLLAFPADGSLPFLQCSPFKSKHQSSEWNRQSLKTSLHPCQDSSLNTKSSFCLQENSKPVAHQKPHKDFSRKKCSVYTPVRHDSASSKGSSRALSFEGISNAYSAKNYSRCLSSHKPDFSVSGISIIPNFHYPVWFKSDHLSSDSTRETDGPSFHTEATASSSQAFETQGQRHDVDKDNSEFNEHNAHLDARGDNKVEESCNYDSPGSHFQPDNWFSSHAKKPLREEQLELLTLKDARGLQSSNEGLLNNVENDVSPSTTDILGAERSWENVPVACKPPVPVCCEDVEKNVPFPKADMVHKFLEDCLNDKNKESTFSGCLHHRPLEALKLMLFKLQSLHGSLSQNEAAEQEEGFEEPSEEMGATFKLCDSEIIPLANSIRRALHHLSRVKSLAEDNSNPQEQSDDHEDKQGEKQ